DDVVLLQYHLHRPRPDPMTNADCEARQMYYADVFEGTPTTLLDGKRITQLGGYRPHGKERFETLSRLVNEALEKEPQAQLKLKAQQHGGNLEIPADVTDRSTTGDNIRLRFVLVEDVVRYPGTNGQRFHHHVVRALPGGVSGIALTEKSVQKTVP